MPRYRKGEKCTDQATLDRLAEARKKALQVRRERAELKKKTKLLEDVKLQKGLKDVQEALDTELSGTKKEKKESKPTLPVSQDTEDATVNKIQENVVLKTKNLEPEESEEEVEIEYKKKPSSGKKTKPKPKRKKIIYVSESEEEEQSESEEEIEFLPKPKKERQSYEESLKHYHQPKPKENIHNAQPHATLPGGQGSMSKKLQTAEDRLGMKTNPREQALQQAYLNFFKN